MLQNFVDKVNVHIRALESLGVTQDAYGCFLVQIVISRLPNFLRLQWARKDPEDNLELKDLIEFLSNESSAIEMTQDEPQGRNNLPKNICVSQIKTVACFKCGSNHYLSECSAFIKLPIEEKISFLNNKKLCQNCFGPKHVAKNCFKNIRCKECNGRHHTLIHNQHIATPILHIDVHKREVLLPTVQVNCGSHNDNLVALLDSGSQATLINRRALKHIQNYTVKPVSGVDFRGVGGKSFDVKCPKVVSFSVNGKHVKRELKAYVVDDLNIVTSVPNNDLSYFEMRDIDMIIGVDCLPAILTGQIKNTENGSLSFETIFGWTTLGTTKPSPPTYCLALTTDKLRDCPNCELLIKQVWTQEVSCEMDTELSYEDQKTEEFIQSHICREPSGRLQTAWPIHNQPKDLLTFKQQAYHRFLNLLKRLEKDSTLMRDYAKIIEEYLDLGIIEAVPDDSESDNLVRYLPHHPVIKEADSRKKIRIVFDASAKDQNGVSLNDIMSSGPNLNPAVSRLLIRFRMFRYAMCADVEKAFLQLSLEPSQRDLTRFFWVDSENQIKTFRFRRVLFGARGSPYLLASAIRFHLQDQPKFLQETAQLLHNHIYIDDLVISFPNETEGVKFMEQSKTVMNKACMNMRGWNSNISSINSETSCKVLGIRWNISEDTINIEIRMKAASVLQTKRELLKWMASFWDPLGFLSSCMLGFKMILRKLWILGVAWDDPIPQELENELKEATSLFSSLDNLKIPRFLGITPPCHIELHGFGDASKDALASVIYIKAIYPGRTTSSFVIAQAKLTPTKVQTIPRLELLAALQTARLVNYVQSSLNMDASVVCWSDSMAVIYWINSNYMRWKPFVANRVKEIQGITDASCWRFVDGKKNPADCISRGIFTTAFTDPPNIIDQPYQRPDPRTVLHETPIEERKVVQAVTVNEPLFDVERFSTFSFLICVTAWVFRFIANVSRSANRVKDAFLHKGELDYSEEFWIIFSQHSFSKNFNKQSSIYSLRPFIDSKTIIRSDRRLSNAGLNYDEKFPIILPKEGHFVKLLIHHIHTRLLHASPQRTICELRNRYWIIQCRNIVRKVINECRVCKRHRIQSCKEPMPPLPDCRVSSVNPKVFLYVGIDFTGPIRLNYHTQNERLYILLITCTRVRAVHLELTTKIDVPSCYNALKRFIFRRGIPKLIISDNAKTFVKISSLMEREFRIQWQFITPYAPWQGGFYERLNRSIKDPLKRAIEKRPINFIQAQTLLCHVEAIINSRPLTPVHDDPNDDYILSPSHFITGGSILAMNDTNKITDDQSVPILTLWRGRDDQLKAFWDTWKTRYLRAIRQKTQMVKNNDLKVGDIVLIANEKGRNEWPMGRVEELKIGRDNRCRSVVVFIKGKEKLRPIQMVYKLEEMS